MQLVAQPLQTHVLLSIVALPIAHLVQSALDLQLSLWGGVGTCITLPYSGYFSGGKCFCENRNLGYFVEIFSWPRGINHTPIHPSRTVASTTRRFVGKYFVVRFFTTKTTKILPLENTRYTVYVQYMTLIIMWYQKVCNCRQYCVDLHVHVHVHVHVVRSHQCSTAYMYMYNVIHVSFTINVCLSGLWFGGLLYLSFLSDFLKLVFYAHVFPCLQNYMY